jgi:cytochrome c biogenesis protein CcdA
MASTADFRAFHVPVSELAWLNDEDAARAAAEEKSSRETFGCILGIVGGFVMLIFLITAIVASEKENWIILGGFAVVVLALAGFAAVIRAVFRPRKRHDLQRFLLFCRANGLKADLDVHDVTLPALPYREAAPDGRTRFRARWMQGHGTVEVGTYSWYASGGRYGTMHTFGYVSLPCSSSVPTTWFDCGTPMNFASHAPDGLTEIASAESYTVYAAAGHTARAQDLYAPELVAILTDDSRPFHVRTVDGHFLAYFPYGQEVDEERWRQIFRLVDLAVSVLPAPEGPTTWD